MFSSISKLKDFIHNGRYLFSSNSIRFFNKSGSKKNSTRLELQKLKAEKTRIDKKMKETEKQSNKKPPNKDEFKYDYLFFASIAIMTYSFVDLLNTVRRLRQYPHITTEEFIDEYLMHGEVKQIMILGPLTRALMGDIGIEIVLHPDEERDVQSVLVSRVSSDRFRKIVQAKEDELGISATERLPTGSYLNESLLVVASLVFAFKHLKVTFGVTKMKDGKTFFDEIAKQKTMEKKKPNDKNVPNSMDLFSDMIMNTSAEAHREKSNIKFKDVAGLHSAKQEVKEFVDYLHNPTRFKRLGAKLPRGAMLLGPPGCGKTLLVKALANETNVPFFYKGGSEFIEMIGGLGAKRLRKLFETARLSSPCIIFIDEIDAIGKKRGKSSGPSASNNENDQTLNQLLVEMDGIDPNAGVVVFAATNRADILDSALIRPGRFDRHILIDLPVLKERQELFALYLSKHKTKLESPIPVLRDKFALLTPGMTGADIANLCNEAALTAARLDYNIIKDECFDIALERIIAGAAKKSKILTESERQLIAYYEAGKVLIGWLMQYADPILKVSIVPRTNANFGFSQIDQGEKYLETTDRLIARITVLLGGRAAESLKFNKFTSGSHNDLQKVKKIAFAMVRELGMSEKVGHLSFSVSEFNENYEAFPYSKNTRELIDSEANSIVSSAYKSAVLMLQNNKDKLELIAQELLLKEVLKFADIEGLIGPRPYAV